MRVGVAREALSQRLPAWSWTRRGLIPLVLLVLVGVVGVLGATRVGGWLVVADPLERAQAIVVLSGRVPFRAMEAASIYGGGWAPEVWITRETRSAEEVALGRLGLTVVRAEVYNREVLERMGVPSDAIRVLGDPVDTTAEEVEVIARRLDRTGGERVILVTSKPHSRRVKATWRALVGDAPRAVVRYTTEEPYDAARWWRHTREALAVSREVFGLMNVWAGFPVRPRPGGG
jgi:uncharacterized SAM-binding protein YcdF (DUF218 family)